MDKKKINFDVRPERETEVFTDKNGNAVVILKRIPVAEKEAFAQEWVEQTLGTNDELGVCYKLMTEDEVYLYLLVKYYTDIDVEEIKDVDGIRNLYDYCQESGVRNELHQFIDFDDVDILFSMAEIYWGSIQKLYEAGRSLGHTVQLLLKTDPDTNNAETKELIEKLIDMKGALLEKEAQEEILHANKQAPANVKTGGAVINLARR